MSSNRYFVALFQWNSLNMSVTTEHFVCFRAWFAHSFPAFSFCSTASSCMFTEQIDSVTLLVEGEIIVFLARDEKREGYIFLTCGCGTLFHER